MGRVVKKKRGPGNPGTPRKYPPVDFSAALEQASHQVQAKGGEEIDFSVAVPKTQPGATRQPPCPPPPANPSTNINNTILGDDVVLKENKFSIKNLLTVKELNFLENFISGEMTIEEAMVLAGYGNLSQRYIYQIAQKTIRKFEQSAPDAKKIFRDIGFGELSVAKGIKRLALKGKSEVVQLNAYALAAKCLQITREQPDLTQGVNIIISCSQEEKHELEPGRIRPATVWLQRQKEEKP